MGNIILATAWGDTLTLVAMCFTIVISIMLIFVGILVVMGMVKKTGKNNESTPKDVNEKQDKKEIEILDVEYAAIATAIHLYFDIKHDEESLVLTIKDNSQNYSPWNIKK